ncbi:MBL fold metallo-hydrolase [Salinimicrobium oceani]|uniref:MBL fold metallo-hydrolase n=1 Tax=Salinimicrobium oceani TaxID=2722702 RepID=A0ABX1CW50_9FLAO|nr:MBL fold metallo-hydrolase [Salinimicrobium oceani]NJW51392.1 MBL fold metallo-hydrolase [Salinimicrobium oceani]
MKRLSLLLFAGFIIVGCRNNSEETDGTVPQEEAAAARDTMETAQIDIQPVSHASAVIKWNNTTIYVDPVGGAEAYAEKDSADIVLITDIHGDHLNPETLGNLKIGNVMIIAPQAVKDQLPDSLATKVRVMNNGEKRNELGFSIEAIPMYNLREEAKQFHPKGRGNGYVLENEGKRLYIAGDTEDIPEMRNLKDIDIALVPMNLPYTMPVEKAAEAVIEFGPDKVYPYHFRGQDGKADVNRFKQLVNEGNDDVEVILANWYPEDAQE